MALFAFLLDNIYTLLIVSLGSLMIWQWIFSRRNLPPGPRGWPIIGAISDIGEEMHLSVMRLGQKYGEVVSVPVANRLMIFLNSSRVVREAFINRGEEFADRPPSNLMKFVNIKDAIFVAPYSPEWKAHKKFVLSALRSFGAGAKSLQDKVEKEVDELVKVLSKQDGRPMCFQKTLAKATGNVITSILFNTRYDHDHPESDRVIKIARRFLEAGQAGPYLDLVPQWLATLIFRRQIDEVRSIVDEVRGYFRNHIKDHQETFDPECLRDVLDVYIKADRLEPEVFVDTVMNFLPDAVDTVALILLWALLILAHEPEVQRKLQEELDDVTGGSRPPTMSDKAKMPYMEATMCEILRFRTVLTMTTFHCTLKDTTFEGFTIPRSAFIMANIYSCHMDPQQWPEPEKFDPGRFLDTEGNTKRTDAIFPFGAGRRMCMGEQLTKMEFFLFLSNLLQRFNFSFPPDLPKPSLNPKKPEDFMRRPEPFQLCAIAR